MAKKKWDAFLCHASEDKTEFVEPLAEELRHLGLEVWYDKFVLKVGDSLRRKVDEGLSGSRFGVVVISPDFFRKNWTREELDGLFTLQMEGASRILPVWHKVTKADVIAHSPILASRFALNSADGIKAVAFGLVERIKPKALKLGHTQRRVQDAGTRFAEQLAEVDSRLQAEVVLSPQITPSLHDLSVAARPGIVASILQDGMRVDLIARDPADYNKNPITGHVTFKPEALEQLSAVQKKGETVTLTDEVVDISVDLFSQLFPGATSGGKVIIRPAAGAYVKKLNFRVTVRAGEQFVQYDRIEFTIERPGSEEVEMVSTAPHLPLKLRLVVRFKDRSCNFKVTTSHFGHEIRDILKADLAVSILAAGGDIHLFDLDSGRNIGSLEHSQADISEGREALSSFIQAAYDVAEAFAQPLHWTGRLNEDQYFKAACLAEIVRKGTLQLPVKSMRLKASHEQLEQIRACISQNRAIGFQRPNFNEADSIFGTRFEVGTHYVYFVPKEIKVIDATASSVDVEVEVWPQGNVVFSFPRFTPPSGPAGESLVGDAG